MTSFKKHPFNAMKKVNCNDLPCHVSQTINDVCAQILQGAVLYNGEQLDPNLSMAGMQKAIAILVGNFFTKETREQALVCLYAAVKDNLEAYSDLGVEGM